MREDSYIRVWLQDFWDIATQELRQIFTDWGVILIFFGAGVVYPLLYNLVYLNGTLEDTPVAIVDMSDCAASRRYAREVDATRECRVAYHCTSMEEAQGLMADRKVNGIIYFPGNFGEKLARGEQAAVEVFCDMSSFLYYKNALMATNHVMLAEIGNIQVERYTEAGYTLKQAEQLVKPLDIGDEINPYNPAFAYNIFLLSTILLVIIQQTLFYGMSLLVGTGRERNMSFASLPYKLQGHGMGRVVLGRGAAYWAVYMAITIYVSLIVPAIFGLPQRGEFWDIILLDLFFVTDCVFFSMAWSTLITKRETVFIVFLFMSPICLFLTGTSWPSQAFPRFWEVFSWLFPTTFGCKAFVNLSTAGGDLAGVAPHMIALTIQTIAYYFISTVAVYCENWTIRNRDKIVEKREEFRSKVKALEKQI